MSGSTDRGIPVGLIGPEAIMGDMLHAVKGFPSFEPIVRAYQSEEEAPGLANALQQQVEVIVFSGPIPHRLAHEQLAIPIPTVYVPLTGAGLFRSLFRIEKRYGLSALSVDTLGPAVLDKALHDLQINATASFYRPTARHVRDRLVAFHREQIESGAARVALTGLHSVSEELSRLGIPNDWVTPTEPDMVVSYERALLATETRKSKEAQIVVGLIRVDGFRQYAERMASEQEVQRLKLDMYRTMLGFAETIEGHLTQQGGEEYLFITTRGVFERETGGYKAMPIAKETEELFGLQLSIGVGFGRSASEAGTHARSALRHAADAGGNTTFIVREDGSLIGPLEMTEPHACDLSLVDAEFLKRAEQAGMTREYVSRLIARVTRSGKIEYDVHELADALRVTVRSTHRLLLAWQDAGLALPVREEKLSSKGRPKQVFELTCLRDMLR